MGISIENPNKKDFDATHVADRDLVLRMLRTEEEILQGEEARLMYADETYAPRRSLTIEHSIQRKVLRQFGFRPSDASLAAYRTIFRTYYDGPTSYDAEILASVTYMRENKLLYYTAPDVHVGQIVSEQLKNCHVHSLDSGTMGLLDAAGTGWKHLFVGAFSTT